MTRRSTPPVRSAPARLVVTALLAAGGVLATSACGYRIVRGDDIRVQKLTADSAAMVTLQRQIVALQMKCHTDSVRAAADRAALEKTITDRPAAPPVTDSTLKARDAEIATLKDQLTKANAELDRIKRRLANPRS